MSGEEARAAGLLGLGVTGSLAAAADLCGRLRSCARLSLAGLRVGGEAGPCP